MGMPARTTPPAPWRAAPESQPIDRDEDLQGKIMRVATPLVRIQSSPRSTPSQFQRLGAPHASTTPLLGPRRDAPTAGARTQEQPVRSRAKLYSVCSFVRTLGGLFLLRGFVAFEEYALDFCDLRTPSFRCPIKGLEAVDSRACVAFGPVARASRPPDGANNDAGVPQQQAALGIERLKGLVGRLPPHVSDRLPLTAVCVGRFCVFGRART